MDLNDLHARACSGDHGADEELLASLAARFRVIIHLRVWNKEDAEDIVQNALMTVNSEYGSVTTHTNFGAWARKVLQNRLLAYLEEKGRRQEKTISLPDSLASVPNDPDPHLMRQLLECLRKLAVAHQQYARIINLHHQGYDRDEICIRLKLTRNNSYVVLSRARAVLRRCLDTGDVSA